MTVREIIRLNYRQFLFVFSAFFVMVIVSYFYTSKMVGEQLMINGTELIQVAEAHIKAELSQSEVFLTDMGMYAEDMLYKGMTPAEIGNMLKRINPKMKVYGFVQDAFVEASGEWTVPPDFDPRTRPWYTRALEAGDSIRYTNTYIDSITRKSIVSLSKQIFDPQKQSAGVIAVDVDLSRLAPLITNLGSAHTSYYGLVLDDSLSIVAHGQNQKLIGQNFASVNEDCARVAEALKKNNGAISGMQFTNHHGTKSIVFFGKLFNGWYTGVITSTSSFYAQVYQMGIVISGLGFVMMFLLSCSLVSIYTAKIRSEEENKSKSNFLAKMSHEIRTPMNAIVGMSELILREDIPPDVREYALAIKQASANLLSIINDILDFSKIESGKMEITEVNYLFSSVINDAVTIIRMRLSEKPVILLVNLDPMIPNKLTGDEVRIRQIILNILNNAVKYTEKGVITFSVEREAGTDEKAQYIILKIAVEDTGIGIKEENFHKVFGDFVQFDKAANKGIEGTGLGLAITKSLCDAMGGEISFTSEYGKGTAFTVVLPQRISDPAPMAEVQDPETKSVLIYELNEYYARSIMQNLTSLKIASQWVTVQSDFYETLKRNPYAFIFVSHILYEGAKKIVERIGLQSTLIMMIEYGSEAGLPEVRTLSMPAHTISIADILNNKAASRMYNEQQETLTRFIAPAARILVVDDISTNLKVAEGLAAPFKMRIDTCKSGAEAVELVKANTYDIVFMDHMMPEMDGIEAAGHIRELGGDYKRLPIIALTANAVSGVREMFLQNGMDDFLSKPIEMSRLAAILQRWIPEEKQEKQEQQEEKEKKENEGKNDADREKKTGAEDPLPAIFSLTGIDVKKGISMTGGTLDSYLSTLGIFLEDGKEKLRQIKACAETGNIPLYTTYIHALKSASGSIGAADISDQAKNLETAGKTGDIAYIEKNNPSFLEDFRCILEDIEEALTFRSQEEEEEEKKGKEGKKEAAEEFKQELRELKEALDMMDTGKADAIITKLHKENRGKTVNSRIEEISKHILLSDYDEAAATIDILLTEGGSDGS